MNVTGIIAEYNPFHNGHKYHLEQAKAVTGCDYTIVVMSGDYTQRGTPAIYSKYMRTRAALAAGADLVIEMPVYGSVASAPDFAECGVMTLHASGVCDSLFFGSESGDIEALKQEALAISDESSEISLKIKEGLKQGMSWPAARAHAYGQTEALSSLPNDILGIEYIRSILRHGLSMEPVTTRRSDPGYHSEERSGRFASATAARKAILAQDSEFLEEVLPEEFFDSLKACPCPPVVFNDYSHILNEKILRAGQEDLLNTASMPEDLARKLYKNKLEFLSAEDMVSARKDRNYTYTRVNRCLLNLILGITESHRDLFRSADSAPWIRILGFRKDAGPLLSRLKQNASVPLITKTAGAETLLAESLLPLWHHHLQTAELYRMTAQLKSRTAMKNEFTSQIVIL